PMLPLLLEQLHASADPILQTLPGMRIERMNQAGELERLAPLLPDVEILGIRSRTQVDREFLERAPRLKAIGAYCTGTNNIDLDAARDHGVAVFNGPFRSEEHTSELQSRENLVCRLLLEKKNKKAYKSTNTTR